MRFHVLFCMLIAHTKAEQWEFWGRFLALTISSRIYMYALNPEGGIFFIVDAHTIIVHCNIIITCENCYAQFQQFPLTKLIACVIRRTNLTNNWKT